MSVLLNEYIRKWTSSFSGPYGICVYGSPGEIIVDEVYVADCYHSVIKVFDTVGTLKRTIGSGQLNNPYGVYVYENEVYVADTGNDRIQVFTESGDWLRQFGSSGTGDGQFQFPMGIFVYNHEVYVTDTLNNNVQVFDYLSGAFKRKWGSPGQFDHLSGICVYDDEVYLVDSHNNRVYVTDLLGTYITQFDSSGTISNNLLFEPLFFNLDPFQTLSQDVPCGIHKDEFGTFQSI